MAEYNKGLPETKRITPGTAWQRLDENGDLKERKE
jgi:hypothetical protein